MTREEILAEIRRTAEENGGKPLGVARFSQVTGIKSYDWMRHWPRFGDAQREAGYEPNVLTTAFSDDFLLQKAAELARELGKFPTASELRLKRFTDSDFPDRKVFENRFGDKASFVSRVYEYAKNNPEYSDVAAIAEAFVPSNKGTSKEAEQTKGATGFVYLFKERPGHYKIGVSDDPERRLYELTKGPYKPELVWKIETDDPHGIEAYWHKRFEPNLIRGEWFRLSAADIAAFKRWKKVL